MNEAELMDSEWFPSFIVMRKPQTDSDNAQNGAGEWQGLLREVQKGVKRQNETMREEIRKNSTKIENEIARVRDEIAEMKGMLAEISKASKASSIQKKK